MLHYLIGWLSPNVVIDCICDIPSERLQEIKGNKGKKGKEGNGGKWIALKELA